VRSRCWRALALAGALLLVACSSHPAALRRGADAPPPGTLRVGIEKPQSLDPAQARTPGELLVADQLFDGLTAYDPATLAVQPSIAARWQASADQRRWDFTLRPGATFANGRGVTSADALQLDSVTGFRAFNLEGKADGLAGVTAPSPDVVHVELDQPLASLPAILAHPAFGIVPREAVEAESPSFSTQPVGSGPFLLQSRRADLLHLVPAPGATTVSVRAVDISMEEDPAVAYDDFVAGRVDWAAVPPERSEQAAERPASGGPRPYLGEVFYGFNLKSPKFADVRFREAIVRAIDGDAIVRVAYGPAAQPSRGIVPQGVPGFQPDACGEKCVHDPARAKALVKEAFGDKPVPEVQIDFDDDTTQRSVAQAMQANLRDAGIPAALRPHPYAEYLTFVRANGPQELFRLGWIGASATPDAFLAPLFLSGLRDNLTGLASPPVDQLVKAARAEPDEAKRTATYQQAEKAVLDQVPILPLAQLVFQSVTSPRVSDLVVSGLGTFDAAKVKLANGR
jgi:ABC-type transport system substrate-binding protein